MVLKPEVVQAFQTLGLTPEAEESVASRTYKKLALIHHPDRNHNDPTATERFQEVRRLFVLHDILLNSFHDVGLDGYRLARLGMFARDIMNTRRGVR
jgi:hypothetical protein